MAQAYPSETDLQYRLRPEQRDAVDGHDNDLAGTGFQSELHDVIIERARALRPLLLSHAQTHEDRGELVSEVIDALDEAGLFRMSAPRRWGGLCLPSYTMANVSRELAKGCPSTAWVVSIVNSCVWIASTMAPSMQELIFADGVPRICGPSNGAGTLELRDGQYVVNGKWSYGSASHHASWAMVPVTSKDGHMNMALLPMSKALLVAESVTLTREDVLESA